MRGIKIFIQFLKTLFQNLFSRNKNMVPEVHTPYFDKTKIDLSRKEARTSKRHGGKPTIPMLLKAREEFHAKQPQSWKRPKETLVIASNASGYFYRIVKK